MRYSIGASCAVALKTPTRGAVIAAGDKRRPATELIPSHAPSRIVADPLSASTGKLIHGSV
jgi:hypothetical protein